MQDTEVNEAQGALVIDIPSTVSAEEATRLLNEQYQRGYYIHRALDHVVGARVFLVRTKAGSSGKSDAHLQTAEARAIQFIRHNAEMSIPQLCAALKALRFVRSPKWVREKLSDIMAARRRIAV